MKSTGADQGGFSLIEAIVALTLLAVALAALLQAMGEASRAAARRDQTMRAAFVAQNLLAGVGSRFELADGAGQFGSEGDFNWSLTMASPLDVAGETLVRALEVRAVVTWSEAGRERRFEAVTTRLATVGRP